MVASEPDPPRRDIVVVGASAGGVQALRVLLTGLPTDFPAAVFVVLHLPDGAKSQLDAVLRHSSVLSVATAREGDEVLPGRILVAPSGQHLLLRGDGVQVRQGPRENGVRPSVDVLFRSAALSYGPRVVSVVLTGLLDDGAAGTREVLRRGGLAVVEDPGTAEYPSMPRHAIEAAPVTHIVELARVAELLVGVVNDTPAYGERPAAAPGDRRTGSSPSASPADDVLGVEMAISAGEAPTSRTEASGRPSLYTCPDCGGVLQESGSRDDDRRFRCRVGDGWSGAALLHAKGDQIEASISSTMHMLEEHVELCLRLAEHARRDSRPASANSLRQRAADAAQRIAAFRAALLTPR